MSKQDKKELRQQIACEWLEENYLQFGSLRHDVVTDRLQIKAYKPTPNPSLKGREECDGLLAIGDRQELWRYLTDKDINTMVCQCVAEKGVNISTNEMWTALKSDMVPAVHPLRAWLDGLRPYTADQPDWIDMVAQQVTVSPSPLSNSLEDAASGYSLEFRGEGNNTTPSYTTLHNTTPSADRLWRACFKKWFVAMVASWLKDEVVNHTVLVLVGRQGIFKTTWLECLIPPHLREYCCKLANANQLSKDDRLRIAEFGLINMDELDAMNARELNAMKSVITATDVNERAAYGYTKERRIRLASFCASSNKREFLTDITGNRRWLPFEVESIQNPFETIFPYDRMYAQARYLIEHDFNYWFELEEIDVLEEHNESFRAQENEEQLLPILFDTPAEGRGIFMTTAQISEHLVSYGNIKKPMSMSQLGMLLGRHGYKSVTRGRKNARARGWIVYQRDTEEINANKRLIAQECVTT